MLVNKEPESGVLCFIFWGVGLRLYKPSCIMAPAMTEQGAKGVTHGPLPLSKGKRKQPSVPSQPSTASSQSQGNLRLGSRECRYVGLLTGEPGKTGDVNRRCQSMTMGTRQDKFHLSRCQWRAENSVEPEIPSHQCLGAACPIPSARTWDGIQGQGGPGRRKNPETDYSCRGV